MEAYNDWLNSRGAQVPAEPPKVFQRALSSHLCSFEFLASPDTRAAGSDGRVSFEPEEEAAILEVLRHKSPWPCFAGTPFAKMGCTGYRSFGFHEKSERLRSFELTCM